MDNMDRVYNETEKKTDIALSAMVNEVCHSADDEEYFVHSAIGEVVSERIMANVGNMPLDQLYEEQYFSDDELAHYGIKGMKWRKHKKANSYYSDAGGMTLVGDNTSTGYYSVRNRKTGEVVKRKDYELPSNDYRSAGSYASIMGQKEAERLTKKSKAKTKAYNRAATKHNINEIKKAAADDFSRMRNAAKKLKSKIKAKLRHADYDDPEQLQRDLAILDQIIDNVENMTDTELAAASEALDRCEYYVSDYSDAEYTDYDDYDEFDDDEELAHYGVKGMKWNHHKYATSIAGDRYNAFRESSQRFIDDNRKANQAAKQASYKRAQNTANRANNYAKNKQAQRQADWNKAKSDAEWFKNGVKEVGTGYKNQTVKTAKNKANQFNNYAKNKQAQRQADWNKTKDDAKWFKEGVKSTAQRDTETVNRRRKNIKKLAKSTKKQLKYIMSHADYDDPELFEEDLIMLDELIENAEIMSEADLAAACEALERCENYVYEMGGDIELDDDYDEE